MAMMNDDDEWHQFAIYRARPLFGVESVCDQGIRHAKQAVFRLRQYLFRQASRWGRLSFFHEETLCELRNSSAAWRR
jgi:hypothetical protein